MRFPHTWQVQDFHMENRVVDGSDLQNTHCQHPHRKTNVRIMDIITKLTHGDIRQFMVEKVLVEPSRNHAEVLALLDTTSATLPLRHIGLRRPLRSESRKIQHRVDDETLGQRKVHN